MGVIGAAMMIQQLSCVDSSFADQTMCQSQSEEKEPHLPASRLKQVQTLISDTIQSCSQSQETATLFCDEMCVAIRHSAAMDPSALRYLCDTITLQFQETFLIDCKDDLPANLGIPVQMCHRLDAVDQDNIALNLLPVAMVAHGPERNYLLQRVSSQFKLLRICEQLLNSGSLEAVDALLGMCGSSCVCGSLCVGHHVCGSSCVWVIMCGSSCVWVIMCVGHHVCVGHVCVGHHVCMSLCVWVIMCVCVVI